MAVSDTLGALAHTRPAINHKNDSELVEAVIGLAAAEGVDEIVVGLPIGMGGQETAQTASVRAVANELRRRIGVPVTEWDERLSSREAERTMRGQANRPLGVPYEEWGERISWREAERTTRGQVNRRSGSVDSAAAAVVLQAVLDSRRAKPE